MFLASQTDPAGWGADLPGSPIFAFKDTWEHVTTFLVPVRVSRTERLIEKNGCDGE
jgi:hypothetical protein